MRSYRPESCSTRTAPAPDSRTSPRGRPAHGRQPPRNGGLLPGPLACPTSATTRWRSTRPARTPGGDARARRLPPRRHAGEPATLFRIKGTDETASNRLAAVFEATNRAWEAEPLAGDDHLAPDGRVMEVLASTSARVAGGYLLTGRHGLFNCYEAFIHIVDSMFNQHASG